MPLVRDAESELFLLAVTNMVGEDTFYERADARDARFVELVHAVTVTHVLGEVVEPVHPVVERRGDERDRDRYDCDRP